MSDLIEEIAIECGHIDRTIDTLKNAMAREEKTTVELTAIGACLHHFYNGIENVLKRLCRYKQVSIPDSASSHKELLDIAIRNGFLSETTANHLDAYRGFRHFFVHGYGVLLRVTKLLPLAEALPRVWEVVKEEIDTFIAA